MPEHRPEEYNTWIKTSDSLPELKRFYWISDGNDIALAVWNMQDMCWKFKYMHSIVKPKYMMPIKLPKPLKALRALGVRDQKKPGAEPG